MKKSTNSILVTGLALLSLSVFANTPSPYEINSRMTALQASNQLTASTEKNPIHFSFPEKGSAWNPRQQDAININSDEYWFQVSGADFKKGFELDVSDPGAVVRFSSLTKPSANAMNYQAAHKAMDIDPAQIIIYKNDQKVLSPTAYMVSEADLSQADLFNDSSLLQLSDAAGSGRLTLKSSQSLPDSDQYLVNVKEYQSGKKLHISAPRLNLLAGEILTFNAFLENEHTSYSYSSRADGSQYQSYLLSPEGERIDISLKGNSASGWYIQLPKKLPNTKPGKLYELYVDAVADEKEGLLKRKAKLAFAIARPTARVENINLTFSEGTAASITLNVASEGRYEVRGTIYGTDNQGQLKSVMRSHSGYWLQPGLQSVALAMDTEILKKSGLKAPFKLMNFEVLDQSQLTVLHSQKIAG